LLASDASNLVVPIIIARAYDALVDSENSHSEISNEINHVMTLVFVLTVASVSVGWIRLAIQGVVGERVVARLRLQLYQSVLKQEIAFFDEHKSGEIVSRLGSDATLLQTSLSQCIPEILSGVSKAIVCIILMFYLSAKLAGMILAGIVVTFLLSFPMGKRLGTLSKKYQDVLGDAQTRSTEVIGSMRTVQSFVAEEKEVKRYEERIGDPNNSWFWWPTNSTSGSNTYQVGFHKALTNSSFFSWIFGGGFVFLYISLWFGFHLVNDEEMTIGDLTAFQSYVFSVAFAVGQAAGNIARLFEAVGASGRILYLKNRVPAIPKPRTDKDPTPVVPKTVEGNVEFHGVEFAYPSRPDLLVLQDYSLTIPANTTTALVGSSGGGKSTVVSLLQRLYDISAGKITIDGNDISQLDLSWLRRHIGYVQQEPHLFGLTVRENLLYGVTREVSQEELENICRDANAHDFIASWPDKYDTLVGERGVKLSGGQKQRIAIARALLTDCRILLLDEATSALDAESEYWVQQAIERAMVGRTVIVVAHRLSTVRQADQIVVMDNHRIVDAGTHDELVASCDKYRELIKRQSVMASPAGNSGGFV